MHGHGIAGAIWVVSRRATFWLASLAWLSVSAMPEARADLLPAAATVNVTFGGLGTGSSGGAPAIAAYDNVGSGCAASVGSGFSSPCGEPINPAGPAVVAYSSTLQSGGLIDFSAFAQLGYEVQIDGPAMSNIPVIMGGNLVAAVATVLNPTGGSANSIAQLNIFDASQRTILETADACSGIMGGCASVFPTTCITDCSSVSVDTIALVNSGDLIMVTLNASASLAGAHSAAATVDPFFKIDPTFPLADEFSIVLSPGIGNPIPSSVPEPSSLTLFAAAVAELGVIRRRRHQPGAYNGSH